MIDSGRELRAKVVAELIAQNLTIATAESLTGGMLGAVLTATPGASASYRGGVVAYATDLKASLLGIDQELLDSRGPVDGRVAELMAIGAAHRCSSVLGLSTTGVAGPARQNDIEPGTVFVGLWDERNEMGYATKFQFDGERAAIRSQTVRAALGLLDDYLSAPVAERG